MSTLFSRETETVVAPCDEAAIDVERRPGHPRIDSASVRWVLAANIAFWLVVYVAGRSFF